MLDPLSSLGGCAILLAAPGPTNIILFNAGATRGLRASLRLVAAEMAGYLMMVPVLVILLSNVEEAVPWLRTALHLLCGFVLIGLGIRMWRSTARNADDHTSFQTLLAATATNPKGLLLVALLPPLENFTPSTALSYAWYGVLLLTLIAASGAAWVLAGALARSDVAQVGRLRRINQICSALLAVIGTSLIAKVVIAA